MKIISFLNKEDEMPIYWYKLNCDNIKDNLYEISETSEIRSAKTKKILKQRNHKSRSSSYKDIALSTNIIKGKSFLVHRLVAKTFIPNPYNKPEVNHKNYDTKKNYCDNLEWMTHKENVEYSKNNIKRGEDNINSSLTNDQVYKICNMLQENKSYSEILFNIGMEDSDNNRDTVGNIKRGITYKNISKQFNLSNANAKSSKYDINTIRDICRYIFNGYDYIKIAELINEDISDINKKKSFYEFIRLIKNRKNYKDISSEYNW